MRGLISTTALAATALLLTGCERTADPAANDSAEPAIAAPGNGVDAVEENSIGGTELAPGNSVKGSDDKGSDDRGSDDRGSDDRGSDDRGSDDR